MIRYFFATFMVLLFLSYGVSYAETLKWLL